jgi:hypothetical protein
MIRLWADDMFHFWLLSRSLVLGLDNFKQYAETRGSSPSAGKPRE